MAHKKKRLLLQVNLVLLCISVSTVLSFWTSGTGHESTATPEKFERAAAAPNRNPAVEGPPAREPRYDVSLQADDDVNIPYVGEALQRIPADQRESIPYLKKLSESNDPKLRLSAVVALRVTKPTAGEALPILIRLLSDSDVAVLSETLFTIGSYQSEAKGATDALVELLNSQEMYVVVKTTMTLGKIGPAARASIPSLQRFVHDKNANIRRAAIKALSNIDSKLAVPYLIELLSEQPVPPDAIDTLRQIGSEATAAVPVLTSLITRKDLRNRTEVITNAIPAIVRIAPEDQGTIPILIELLGDDEEAVRREAAHGLVEISSRSLQDKTVETIDLLGNAYTLMLTSQDSEIRYEAAQLRLRLDRLREIRLDRLNELRLKQFWLLVHEHVIGIFTFSIYILFLLVSLVIYWFFPLLFLRVSESLGALKVPKFLPLVGGSELPLSYLFAIGLLPYRPFVLDAWVTCHIKTAQRSFANNDTVKEHQEHIRLPILLDGEKAENYGIHDFQSVFSHNLNCLLIRGSGGSGKTSLACLFATWAMTRTENSQSSPNHLMLPVLIDHTFELHGSSASAQVFTIIQKQIRRLLDLSDPPSAKLIRLLLKSRRVLVIVDAFSEMDRTTREKVLTAIDEIPIAAVIVTSRNDEHLGGLKKNIIRLLELSGSHVPTFIENYLENRKKRSLLEGEKLMEVSRRLMLLGGKSGLTTVLAKYYVELKIAAEESVTSDLPGNIPDLMENYIDIVYRKPSSDSPGIQEIHNVAEIAAWFCLRKTYRVGSANYREILTALGRKANGVELLTYLREPLRIIKADGASYDRIRFVLDPLAEYLAALHIVRRYGSRKDLWEDFLQRADNQDGSPRTIKAFLVAVHDCCVSKGAEAQVPDFLYGELTKRVTMALVQDLKSSEPNTREEAAKSLGDMRQDAVGAVGPLTDVLSDRHDSVRRSAEMAIDKIRGL